MLTLYGIIGVILIGWDWVKSLITDNIAQKISAVIYPLLILWFIVGITWVIGMKFNLI